MSEPGRNTDSEGHALEGLEVFNGESKLERFSRILQEAQEKAQEIERSKGKKHKPYTGHSHMTVYQCKWVQITLAKKGFLPMDEFLRLKNTQEDTAALTAGPEAVYEELEESSNDGGPNLNRNDAANNCDAELLIDSPPSPDILCLDTLCEEEEESTESENEAESDSHTGSQQDNPNSHDLEQEQIVARMPSSTPETPHSLIDRTMNILRDLPRLGKARKELTLKVNDKTLDVVFRVRVQAMVGLLNLFLDPGIKCTWREASQIMSKAQGHGESRARHIRAWVLRFVRSRTLPIHQLGLTRRTVLEDEDIAQELQLSLSEKVKKGVLKAADVVILVASTEVQQMFSQRGICKPSILE